MKLMPWTWFKYTN